MNVLIGDLCVYFSTGSHIYMEKCVEFVLCTLRENRMAKYLL